MSVTISPPSGNSRAADILESFLPQINTELVCFGGDLNLKHLIWGDSSQNDESMEFMDSIDETDLMISPPPQPTHEKGGILDIFFMSPLLSNHIIKHRIIKTFKNIKNKISDHFLQIIDFSNLGKKN